MVIFTNCSFPELLDAHGGMSKWELSLSLLFLIVSINKLGWLLHHLSIPPPSWNNKVANGKTKQLPLVYRYEPPPLHLKRKGQLPECWGRVPAVGEKPPSQSCGPRERSSATDERDLEEREPGNVTLLTPSSPVGVTQWLNPGLVETKRAKGVLPGTVIHSSQPSGTEQSLSRSLWRAKWGLSRVIRLFLILLTGNVSVYRDQVRWEYPSLIWTLNFISI